MQEDALEAIPGEPGGPVPAAALAFAGLSPWPVAVALLAIALTLWWALVGANATPRKSSDGADRSITTPAASAEAPAPEAPAPEALASEAPTPNAPEVTVPHEESGELPATASGDSLTSPSEPSPGSSKGTTPLQEPRPDSSMGTSFGSEGSDAFLVGEGSMGSEGSSVLSAVSTLKGNNDGSFGRRLAGMRSRALELQAERPASFHEEPRSRVGHEGSSVLVCAGEWSVLPGVTGGRRGVVRGME